MPHGYIGGAFGFCGLNTMGCPGGYTFSFGIDKGLGTTDDPILG